MPKKRDFPTDAITCPCGRILSPNLPKCRGCGSPRPAYGPGPAKKERRATPKPPAPKPQIPDNENFFDSTIKFKDK